jgi:hypothetical protein
MNHRENAPLNAAVAFSSGLGMAGATLGLAPPPRHRRRRRSLKSRIRHRFWRIADRSANAALWTFLSLPVLWLIYAVKSMLGIDIFPGMGGIHMDPANIAKQLGYFFQ